MLLHIICSTWSGLTSAHKQAFSWLSPLLAPSQRLLISILTLGVFCQQLLHPHCSLLSHMPLNCDEMEYITTNNPGTSIQPSLPSQCTTNLRFQLLVHWLIIEGTKETDSTFRFGPRRQTPIHWISYTNQKIRIDTMRDFFFLSKKKLRDYCSRTRKVHLRKKSPAQLKEINIPW